MVAPNLIAILLSPLAVEQTWRHFSSTGDRSKA